MPQARRHWDTDWPRSETDMRCHRVCTKRIGDSDFEVGKGFRENWILPYNYSFLTMVDTVLTS